MIKARDLAMAVFLFVVLASALTLLAGLQP